MHLVDELVLVEESSGIARLKKKLNSTWLISPLTRRATFNERAQTPMLLDSASISAWLVLIAFEFDPCERVETSCERVWYFAQGQLPATKNKRVTQCILKSTTC